MKFIEGNLLDLAEEGRFDIIVHGANCFCTMGSGIARQIKERYPKAYLVDQLTRERDKDKLGKFTQAYVTGFRENTNGVTRNSGWHYNFTIINAYTQYYYGGREVHADYDAIKSVFKQIKMLYDMNPQAPLRIGIPQIGAGLAGGDWKVIEKIIDDIGFSDLTCVIYKEEKCTNNTQ